MGGPLSMSGVVGLSGCLWPYSAPVVNRKDTWLEVIMLAGQDPGGPHVGPMNFAIWECILLDGIYGSEDHITVIHIII